MPADEERQVVDGLSRLRSDVDRVVWADAESIRRRGRHRTQQQLAAGTLAVTLGIGMVGVAIAGWQPWADDSSLVANPGAAHSSSVPASEQDPGTSDGRGTTALENRETRGEVAPSEPRTGTTEVREPTRRLDPSPGDTADDTPSADDSPTRSSSPTADPPPRSVSPTPSEATAAALLTAGEMPVAPGADSAWREQGTRDGEGSTKVSLCAAGTLESLGATDVIRRDYASSLEPSATGANAVAVFDSAEAARAAFDTYAGWAANCAWGDERYGPTSVGVDEGTARWWWARRPATETDPGEVEVVGLVHSGTAVSVVSWHRESASFSGDEAMSSTLRSAAERIARYAGS